MTIFYQDNTPFRMQYCSKETVGCVNNSKEIEGNKKNCKTMAMSIGTSESDSSSSHVTNSNSANKEANGSKSRAMGKRPGKRPGRKPAKIDERAKLERSRQSAKECRARKKLRYQYLEELVLNREKAVFSLREELETFKQWCIQLDRGTIPDALIKVIANEEINNQRRQEQERKRAAEVHNQSQQHHHKQQQEHQPQKQQQLTASTSGASRLYLSPQSTSSSSSCSPSPPQPSGPAYHPKQTQQQQQPQQWQNQYTAQVHSRLPPPYPMSTQRSILTRQVAFDQDTESRHLSSSPQQQQPQFANQATKMVAHSDNTQNTQSAMSVTTMVPVSQLQHQHSGHFLIPSDANPIPQSTNSAASVSHRDFHHHHHQQQQTQPSQQQPQPISYQQGVLRNTDVRCSSSEQIRFIPSTHQQAHRQLFTNTGSNQANPTSSPSLNRVKSEPPMTSYDPPSLEDISDLINRDTKFNASAQQNMSSSSANQNTRNSNLGVSASGSRMRSLSNPIVMNRSTNPCSSGSNSFPNVLSSAAASSHSTSEIGLFSGIPLASSATLVEDSDSSEENNLDNTWQLFQPSSLAMPQKRTLSDPSIRVPNKKSKLFADSDSDLTLEESIINFLTEADQSSAPFHTLPSPAPLTTSSCCMGSTGTLNTPSTSPFAVMPRNTDSPATICSEVMSPAHSMHTGTTSSTNPSPAPLTSFLENSASSSALPSALMESEMDTVVSQAAATAAANMDNFLFSTHLASPVVCSQTGLTATISEHIPEWYSFLEDLETSGEKNSFSPLPDDVLALSHHQNQRQQLQPQPPHSQQPQQMVSSGHSNPSYAYYKNAAVKEEDMDVSRLNVPSILEELSNSDDSA